MENKLNVKDKKNNDMQKSNKNDDTVAIFEEISEQVRQEQFAKFIKENYKVIIGVISAIVIGIIIYSTWNERQKRKMEDITNALLTIVQNPSSNDDLMLGKLLESAPSELRPILMIMKSGKQLILESDKDKNLAPLLDLANRQGVDLIWKDLAMLIYASYSEKSSDELIELVKPLTQKERPFRFSAMEFIAMSNISIGKNSEAIEYLKKIVNSNEAPKSMKERISVVLQYIKNENNKNADEKEKESDTQK